MVKERFVIRDVSCDACMSFFLQLSIAKSPVGGAVCVIVSLEDKGLVMDMNDTGKLLRLHIFISLS